MLGPLVPDRLKSLSRDVCLVDDVMVYPLESVIWMIRKIENSDQGEWFACLTHASYVWNISFATSLHIRALRFNV